MPTVPGTQVVPGSRFHVEDSIDEVSLDIADGRHLHVAWTLSIRDSTRGSGLRWEVWYQRLDTSENRWTEPIRVGPGELGRLRVIADGPLLHIVTARYLTHYLSNDGGETWGESVTQKKRKIIANTFDLIRTSRGPLLAYLAADRGARATEPGASVGVWVMRLTQHGYSPAKRIADFAGPHSGLIDPRLLADGDTLSLFYSIAQRSRGLGPVNSRRSRIETRGRLFTCLSRDAGEHWGSPTEIGPLTTPGASQSGSTAPGIITELDVLHLGPRWVVLFNSSALYSIHSTELGSWGPCARIAGPPKAGYRTKSPAAAAADDKGLVAWIDTRFVRKVSALEALARGAPPSEAPEWANNDVLAVPGSALLDDPTAVLNIRPLRLTHELSYASSLAAVTNGNRVHLVWGGRERVGRGLQSAMRPPVLFHAAIEAQ